MTGRPHGLRVYRSNRMERLVEALGTLVSEPLDNPLAPECILVPGRGVAQWLSLRLAERFGVWSNMLYLYPRNFVGFALDRVLGKPGQSVEAFDQDRLLWSIFGTLGPLLSRSEFETIQHYVARDPTGVRYYELCGRIAFTFDRYATYRPEMLQSWERSAGNDSPRDPASQLALFGKSEEAQGWQPVLWRALVERWGPLHSAALERRFLRNLKQAKHVQNLPARISCLGVTHLPPSYTRLLVALCPHLPVHMFQLSASDSTELGAPSPVPARARAAGSGPARARGQNPLVQSLGTLASEFESVLAAELERQGVATEPSALYEPPTALTRLGRLQREILNNQPPNAQAESGPQGIEDESIRIHVCHSPMREVEVIFDQLLGLLASDAGFEPRDVIVMMPDIELYAPLILAVFQRTRDDAQRIPYSIADRAAQTAAPVVDALERFFALIDQRLSASQLLDLLALDVVAARFDITPQDLEQMTAWLAATNVRWGIDAAHKELHGHPRSDANTWRLGLKRLFFGYAIETEGPRLVFDTLPARGVEGSLAQALGKLAHFAETLFSHLAALGRAHPAAEWPDVVGGAVEALCLNDADTAWQHQELREAVASLGRHAATANYAEPIGGAAFGRLLFEAINAARPSRGFMTGGVTFCSMVPLRTIPFRVVCMLGLSDGQFPRNETSTDFDLMLHGPQGRRTGDRSRRSEDRYLFLEAILSARERLIITYTGQSIRDNAALPPSVVVSELCDYLAVGDASLPKPGRESHIVRHPLQAFSPRYFDGSDPRLFSYATHYLEGARTRGLSRSTLPAFFANPLPAGEVSDALAIADLTRFFENPTGYLLNRRLELFLDQRDLEVPDREPQELSPLDKYNAGQQLLELLLRDVPLGEALRLIRATGALPLGAPGEIDFLGITASAAPIAERVLAVRAGGRLPPLSIEHRLASGRQLLGSLTERFASGMLAYQFSRVRARHLLSSWIRHLVYVWQAPAGARAESALIGRPDTGEGVQHHRFGTVSDPARHLEALVQRFDEGQRRPLWLFPSTSLFFAESQKKRQQRPNVDWRGLLQREWEKELGINAHLERVYGQTALLSDLRAADRTSFEDIALEVFEPLLEHLIEPDSVT